MKVKRGSVTPWEVSGSVDYNHILKEFGTEKIAQADLEKVKEHKIISRGLYFAQRDFHQWIQAAESKKPVSILTGRGPSERMHLGHLVPFMLALSLQKKYSCPVYIPISDDEKFFAKKDLMFEEVRTFAEDNALDILAMGFKPGKTFIMYDFSYAPIYRNAAKLAKLISYSAAKAIFGLKSENNIGWSFYPAVQAAHILLPQFVEGPHNTLVPVGIDQDPFIRLTRDLAQHSTIGFVKPSGIYAKFLPGLKGSAKMSSSDQETSAIYLSDTPEIVKKKINKYAFSGGKDTLEEHRKHGGNPDVDTSFLYLKYLLENDDSKMAKIESDYRSGKMLSGELKSLAIEKINSFLSQHRKNRESIKKNLDKFMLPTF